MTEILPTKNNTQMPYQPNLLASSSDSPAAGSREVRVFAEDEIVSTLRHLPAAGKQTSFGAYKSYLRTHLPYNSAETRQRRASYILERFYPEEDLNNLLTLFTLQNQSPESLQAVVFYHLAKAEPLLARVADQLVYPALPIGKVDRDQLKDFIAACLPKIKPASQRKVLRSLFHAYDLLGVGRTDSDTIKFQLHPGNLHAFVYILASEYPEPGMHSFESLFAGPAHRWLLWDREWMRLQLYALRDMKVVSKVSEIDTMRQFSLAFGPRECLDRFFSAAATRDPFQKEAGGKDQ